MASLIFISLAFVVACSSIAACCPLSAAAAAYLLANQTKMPVELLAKDTLTLFMVNRQAMWPRGAALLSGAWHTHTLSKREIETYIANAIRWRHVFVGIVAAAAAADAVVVGHSS